MILVTAATGQVGSAALQALAAAGNKVRALVRNPSSFTAQMAFRWCKGILTMRYRSPMLSRESWSYCWPAGTARIR